VANRPIVPSISF